MDAVEAEEDRRWQRIAARWRADEAGIRAPQNAVRRALQAATVQCDPVAAAATGRLRVAAAALLALAVAIWLLPASAPIPGEAAPVLQAHPTIHDRWLPDEPCGRYSSCVDAYAELAYLEVPGLRGS